MTTKRPGSARDAKGTLRHETWKALRDAGVARFPGARGRIPNFVGAEAAARRLTEIDPWKDARTIKCNPDSPQRPVRRAALEAGKRLYMPAPRLADEHPFIELDPSSIPESHWWPASSIKGAFDHGRPITLGDMPAIDLIVTGCVAVTPAGARLGKGGGYSDLEYALLREIGRVTAETPIATTVHSIQVLENGAIPVADHDISLDWISTESELIRTHRTIPRPSGILRSRLDDDHRAAIPILHPDRR